MKVTDKGSWTRILSPKIDWVFMRCVLCPAGLICPATAEYVDRNARLDERPQPTLPIGVSLTDKARARPSFDAANRSIQMWVRSHLDPNGVRADRAVQRCRTL